MMTYLSAFSINSIFNSYAPLGIGIALASLIQFGGSISGAHYNPLVSIIMYLNKNLAAIDLLPYMTAQILGGIMALLLFNTSESLSK